MRESAGFVEFTERLKANPHGYTFFAAMRGLEERAWETPRFSEASSPSQDRVRLGQFPELAFPLSDIHSVWQHPSATVPVVNVQFHGLFGSQGALPLHLTEYARERWIHEKDKSFVCFVNLFQHRWFTLFYRAWANSQLMAGLHRPEPSSSALILSSVCGQADKTDASPRVQFAGFFQNQRRSSEGLASVCSGVVGVRPSIKEFEGCWLPIPPAQRSQLKRHGRGEALSQLGCGAVLGNRVWDVQSKVELVFEVNDLTEYERFNPLKADIAPLRYAVDDYLNGQTDWGYRLRLPATSAQGMKLGQKAQLGWTTWLGQPTARGKVCEVQQRISRGVSRFD